MTRPTKTLRSLLKSRPALGRRRGPSPTRLALRSLGIESLEDRISPDTALYAGGLEFLAQGANPWTLSNGNANATTTSLVEIGLNTQGSTFTPELEVPSGSGLTLNGSGLDLTSLNNGNSTLATVTSGFLQTYSSVASTAIFNGSQTLNATGGGLNSPSKSGITSQLQVESSTMTVTGLTLTSTPSLQATGSFSVDGITISVPTGFFVNIGSTGPTINKSFSGTLSSNPTLTIGSASFTLGSSSGNSTSVTAGYDASLSPPAFYIDGSATFNWNTKSGNSDNISVTLGNSTNDGLVLSNTGVTSAYATISGSFSVGELTFAANSLTLNYSQGGNYQITGGASLTVGSGDTIQSVSANLPSPGLQISNGTFTGISAQLDGTLHLGGLTVSAQALALTYSSTSSTYQISGGIEIDLSDKIKASSTISSTEPLTINASTGAVDLIDGFGLSVTVDIGDFELSGSVTYAQASGGGYDIDSHLTIKTPGDIVFDATLDIADGQLVDIGVGLSAGKGIPVGDTGLYITWVYGALQNINTDDPTISAAATLDYGEAVDGVPPILEVTGAVQINKEELLLSADPSNPPSIYTSGMVSASDHPLGIELEGGALGQFGGSVDLNWSTGVYEVDANGSLLDGLATFDFQMYLTDGGDLSFSADVGINIPSFIPVIGGLNLASGHVRFEYQAGAPSSNDYVAAWASIPILGTAGVEYTFDGHFSFLNGSAVRNLENQGKGAPPVDVAYKTETATVAPLQTTLQYTVSDPLLDQNIYPAGSTFYNNGIDYQQTNWIQITDPNGNVHYGNLANSATGTDYPTNEIYTLTGGYVLQSTAPSVDPITGSSAPTSRIFTFTAVPGTYLPQGTWKFSFIDYNASNTTDNDTVYLLPQYLQTKTTTTPAPPAFIQQIGSSAPWTTAVPTASQHDLVDLSVGVPIVVYNNTSGSSFTVSLYATTTKLNLSDDLTTKGSDPASNGNGALLYQEVDTFQATNPDGTEFYDFSHIVPYSTLPFMPDGVTGVYFYVVVDDGLNAPVRSDASTYYVPVDSTPQITAPSVEVVAPGQTFTFTADSKVPTTSYIEALDPELGDSETVTIVAGDHSLNWTGSGISLFHNQLTASGLTYTAPTTPGIDTITITATIQGPGSYTSTATKVIQIVPPNNVDLSVSQEVLSAQNNSVIASTDGTAVSVAVPSAGLPVVFRLTATAAATIAATAPAASGVTVQYAVPSDVTYSNYTVSQGTYNPTTGIWTIGNIASGSSVTLKVYGKVGSGPVGDEILSAATVIAGKNSDGTPQVDTEPDNNSTTLTLAAAAPISGVVYLADYSGGAANTLNPRVPNLTVELIDLRPVGGGNSKVIGTTTTDSNGLYNFASPNGSGQYQVAILATPTSATPLSQYNANLTQTPYSFNLFGVTPTTINGKVLIAHGNVSSNLPSSAFSPAGGELVYVDLNGDGQFDPGDPSTVTDTNGNYTLKGLMPGIYTIREYLGAGRASVGTASRTVNSSSVGNNLVSITLPTFEFADERTVSGYWFIDSNGNTIDDSGESGLANNTIVLQQLSSTGSVIKTLGYALTDPSGMYYFENSLSPGYYVTYVGSETVGYVPTGLNYALNANYFEVNATGTISTFPGGLGNPVGTVLNQNWVTNFNFPTQARPGAVPPIPIAGDDSLVISEIPPVKAGQLVQFTVTAEANGVVDRNYVGTIDLATTDPNGFITGSYTFTAADRGVHTFNVQLMTTGQWTINVQDPADQIYTAVSQPINVSTGQASQCVVVVPTAVADGQSFNLALHPVDSAGNAAVTYWGTADITVSLEAGGNVLDTASLPPDLAAWIESGAGLPSTFHFSFDDHGTHSFSLQAPTLSAGDLADLAALGVTSASPLSLVVNVADPQGLVAVGHVVIAIRPRATASAPTPTPTVSSPAATIDVRLQGPTQAIAGLPIHLTLTTSAVAGRADAVSLHMIKFTSTDPTATLPADISVMPGASASREVVVTFGSAGIYVVRAIDASTGAIVGQETVSVQPAQATPAARLVDAVFEMLVGQPAEPAALAQWSPAIAKGGSASHLATAVTHSAAYIDPEVDAVYESLLDRAPTAAELKSATVQIRHGGSVQDVEVSVLGSQAFRRLRASRRASFLSSLAETLLGRQFSAKQENIYSAQVAHGATRTSVAAAVLDSPAAARIEAESLYEELLFREPSQHELVRLTPTLETKRGRATAVARIVDTPAFRGLAGDPVIHTSLASSTGHGSGPLHAAGLHKL